MKSIDDAPAAPAQGDRGAGPAQRRAVSTGLYILALLVFSLPFATASCGARQVASLTGRDLALGVDLGSRFGSRSDFGLQAGQVPADGWTLLVWLLPLLGIAMVWLGATRLDGRIAAAATAAIGAIGLVRMLVLLGQIHSADAAARRQTGEIGHIDPAFGLYVALALFASIAAWGGWCLRSDMRRSSGP